MGKPPKLHYQVLYLFYLSVMQHSYDNNYHYYPMIVAIIITVFFCDRSGIDINVLHAVYL